MPKELKYGNVTLQKGDIPANEPVFLFRARDILAEKYIRMYAEERRERGCTAKELSNLLNAAEMFRNYDIKKLPG